MSDAFLPLLYVLLGGLLAPFTQGIGYLVTRNHRERDEARKDKRQALSGLQDAILDLVDAEAEAIRPENDRAQAKSNQAREVAMRRIRLMAARIGDDQLWALVHKANPNRMSDLFNAHPGQPGDEYDLWNNRIRELYATLDD